MPLIAVLFYTITLQALPAQETLDCEKLAPLWYSKYVKDFSIRWDTRVFHCPGTEVTNDSKYSPNFYLYVKENLVATNYDSSCKFLATGAEGALTLCPAFFRERRENRAATLVHVL